MIGAELVGMREAAQILERIVSDVAREDVLVAAALVPAAADAETMAARARKDTGKMADALAAAPSEEHDRGEVAVRIGPRASAFRKGGHGYLVRFWELGTSRRAAEPFMRPTWDERAGTFTARFVAQIRPVYERAIARFARRAA